nr:peptidase dimerization domain-containing protein [Vallitaleaceae bacterium]
EVRGTHGAGEIVKHLEKTGISFEYLIDEGGCVTKDAIKEINRPLALIGIAEKGYADIELTVKTKSGHSSTPPKHTSVGLLAQAIVNLERHQMKMSLATVKGFFKKIGPELKGMNKIITANLWLFGGLFKQIFSKTNNGNALLRTTTAATVFEGGIKANVLPEEARAIVNFRIGSHQTIDEVVSHIKKVNKRIPLDIKVLEGNNPSKVSSETSTGFRLIESAIGHVFDNVVIAPYLTLARTDAIKYEAVVTDMYRFAPYQVSNAELANIHGVNERISLVNIDRAFSFYEYICLNCR